MINYEFSGYNHCVCDQPLVKLIVVGKLMKMLFIFTLTLQEKVDYVAHQYMFDKKKLMN